MTKFDVILNCIVNRRKRTRLYTTHNAKTTRIGDMLYRGTVDDIVVERYNETARLHGIAAQFVFWLI